ncbi:hypothetical protein [Bacillus sp. TL12]|uniref:hypothetical protein n=1 Tax=Bacillus sp. TL12 TaxID=2894756 RepID=UPI001F525652|nr:hypothetical protein [Bacillus sp. TL12]MCI0767438.1 hypothetical protein [Bacillus sp. TL12]
MKCKHKWIDMEDGTNDRFCVKCSQKAKQMAIALDAGIPGSINITVPITREMMTVQSYGRLHEVDKEQWKKEFYKKVHLGTWIE